MKGKVTRFGLHFREIPISNIPSVAAVAQFAFTEMMRTVNAVPIN
jgi:hypothetical protein